MKNSNDAIGNRTRELPAFSAVSQTPARSSNKHEIITMASFPAIVTANLLKWSAASPLHVKSELASLCVRANSDSATPKHDVL